MTADDAARPSDVLDGLADVRRVFFSFPEVTDPARHGDYNAWHQFDHLPQNLALPGVRHGQRWVRTPALGAAAHVGDDELAADLDAAHYVAMYWFAQPTHASVKEWFRLGSRTGEVGRRPDLDWTRRRFTGFFTPVDSAVGSDVLVTVGAVPLLPHAGLLVDVSRTGGAGGTDLAVADLTALPGVLGAYAFEGLDASAGLRVTLAWVSEDPAAVAALAPPPSHGTLLRTAVEVVTPGRWDWFDA
ncbi:MAG: hypothetical protein ACI379_04425 [Nocardioides sp.]|uniref:hypothetical protein n=1 Tax=Nocardioides sp. TaxID=35761 RepID=UPI003F006C07